MNKKIIKVKLFYKKSALINSRSVRNKSPLFISFISDNDIDIFLITETWLSSDVSPIIASLNDKPPYIINKYLFKHYPRDSINYSGGIGIPYKSTLIISNIDNHNFVHSEELSCSISPPYFRTFNDILFYRPSSPSPVPFIEFSLFLSKITPSSIILGDFNIPFLPPNRKTPHVPFQIL